MANVIINDNTKYVRLDSLDVGDYFILSGDLYILKEIDYNGYFECFNLSDNEDVIELDDKTKVIPVSSEKVKIEVEV